MEFLFRPSKRRGCKILLATLFLVFLQTVFAWNPPSRQKVLLSQVDTLTLHSDRTTEYRRTKPFPQLTCVGGDAMNYGYKVDAMQCKNMGGSYGDKEDVQWSCTAELPNEFKLGRTDVICEGYSSPDDIYVLKGSCAVEYTLYLTPKGREKYLSRGYSNPFSSSKSSRGSHGQKYTSSFSGRIKEIISKIGNVALEYPIVLLAALLVGYYVLKWIFYNGFKWLFPENGRASTGPRRPRMPFSSRFFGGGGDNPRGPPPPYPSDGPPSSRKTYQVPPETRGWTPGFWTGLASGTAAGYGLGSMRNGRPRRGYSPFYYAEDAAAWPGGNGSSTSTYSSSSLRGRDDDSGSGTHTSTGFGGTRRR